MAFILFSVIGWRRPYFVGGGLFTIEIKTANVSDHSTSTAFTSDRPIDTLITHTTLDSTDYTAVQSTRLRTAASFFPSLAQSPNPHTMLALSIPQPFNSTLVASIAPIHLQTPFYLTTNPSVLPFLSDKWFSLLAPVVAYWAFSLLFLYLDIAKFPYFEARRIHESPEVLSRNKATLWEVVKAVAIQHAVQTALGVVWYDDEQEILKREVYVDHLDKMSSLAPWIARAVYVICGRKSGEDLLRNHGQALVQWMYWWGIPIIQLGVAL